MAETLIIVNPVAGGGLAARMRPVIARYFFDHARPVDLAVSKSTENFRHIATQAIASGYRYIIALGGDGAFHHLVDVTFGSSVILGLLPAGNGNDIAEGLNLPRDLIEAAHAFLHGRPGPIDAVRANFPAASTPAPEAIFIGAGGLGLDAEAAQLANTRFRAWPGVTRYIAGVLWARRKFQSIELEAAMDGESWYARVLFAAVANAPCYGSGVRIAPSAKMDDGWLEVTLVEEMPLSRLVEAIPIVLRSGDIRWPEVHRYRCRNVKFQTNRPALVHGDGEILGDSPVEFEIVPGAVQIMLPRKS
ncbi:MAG: diacylglycerol kinase family protein [Candidatus Acidiferrales bacterium]